MMPWYSSAVPVTRLLDLIFGTFARHVDLREAAVGREDENALRRLAERKRFLAVRRRDLGDHEIPGTDELVPEALRRGGVRHDVLPGDCAVQFPWGCAGLQDLEIIQPAATVYEN